MMVGRRSSPIGKITFPGRTGKLREGNEIFLDFHGCATIKSRYATLAVSFPNGPSHLPRGHEAKPAQGQVAAGVCDLLCESNVILDPKISNR